MKIAPGETELIGHWTVENGSPRGNSVCDRIEWLTAHHLEKIAISEHSGAWETLFQNPDDGRYWERTYPQSQMHGGGPPALKCISREAAMMKYGRHVE